MTRRRKRAWQPGKLPYMERKLKMLRVAAYLRSVKPYTVNNKREQREAARCKVMHCYTLF